MKERVEMTYLTNEQLATPSKYEGIESAMVAELMVGFRFGTGVIFAIRMVNSLDYCVEKLMSIK